MLISCCPNGQLCAELCAFLDLEVSMSVGNDPAVVVEDEVVVVEHGLDHIRNRSVLRKQIPSSFSPWPGLRVSRYGAACGQTPICGH